MLLRILVTMLLWKDYLLRDTVDRIFCYSVKVQVMILLQCNVMQCTGCGISVRMFMVVVGRSLESR